MSSTNVVANITSVGLIPADRPRDHVQRIFTGIFFGCFIGAILAILFFSDDMSLLGYAIPFILTPIVALIGYALWVSAGGKKEEGSVPVVAKVLGTAESDAERRTRTGDVVCPVIVRPLEGSDFRSTIVSTSETKEPAKDLSPGTIIALHQVEPGVGDLVTAPASDEQRELMARWAKNPKLVSNRAPALKCRRAPLERKPFSAALEFYLALGAGAGLMFTVLQVV